MPSVQDFRDGLTDESLRTAILVGLATVPFTVVSSWGAVTDETHVLGGSTSGWALVLAALYVGYRYSDREISSRRAGFWTGLAGSLATVLVTVANTITTIRSISLEWALAAVAATPVFVALGVGFTVLVTMLVAQFAGWVTRRVDRDRRVGESTADDRETVLQSRWWLPIAGYAILAPITLGYMFWEVRAARNEAWILVSIVAAIGLFGLSIAAFVGLFIDATAPRGAETGWIPNVWAYVGVPIGAYALAYLVALALSLSYPPGYAIYSFFGALWLAAAVYVVFRWRHVSTVSMTARL